MLRTLVLLSCVALAIGGHLDGRIVGGVTADIKDFPYQVSMRYFDDHICGATILNKNTVLTAAHCTDGLSAQRMSIRVGNTDNNKGDFYEISEFIQHPDYNEKTYDNDISVLKVKGEIVFKSTVQAINMIKTGQALKAGTQAVVSGWGDLHENDNDNPDILHKVDLTLISEEECKGYYGQTRLTKAMICAKSPGKDSCQGDSGGPFVQNNQLIGVVSWGIGCARDNYAGIYTKVSLLRPWVEKYM